MSKSPTGRTPREPELQDLRRHISNPEVTIRMKDIDFAELELRVLAGMTGDIIATHIGYENLK